MTNSGHVELIRSFYEAAENLFAGMDDNIIWEEMEGMPYGGRYEGKAAASAGVFDHLGSDWTDFSAVPDSISMVGSDQVLSIGFYRGTSKRTGRPLEAAFAHLYTIRNGKAIRFQQFADTHRFREPML